jgi:hypothetical protein
MIPTLPMAECGMLTRLPLWSVPMAKTDHFLGSATGNMAWTMIPGWPTEGKGGTSILMLPCN